jgi:CDP-diacylglycerol pyrophosphatase
MFSPRLLAPCVLLLLTVSHADVRQCACDVARPETLLARDCSLCKTVEEQPGTAEFFTLADTNPNKKNRLLAVPRSHGVNPQHLGNMDPAQRTAYWTFAIAKARALWGEEWGLAVNSLDLRTQCHMHIHIGKLRDDVENGDFRIAASPAEIGAPEELDGIWVHPVGGKYHVHFGNKAPELLLYR